MAGLTSSGFVSKTLEEILAEIEADQRAALDPNLDVGPDTPLGQINAIIARQQRQVWELAEAVYASQHRESAEGLALTNLAALTGTRRMAATKSTVTATVNVDPGTYAIGTLVAHVAGDPTARFVNAEAAVNGGGSADDVDVLFEAEDAGPVRANASTLTVIAEAVSGWNTVTNATDADMGEEEETDADLRTRTEAELTARGGSTVDSIRVDVLQVEGVETCTVLENVTDSTVDGMPPHSIEVVVSGGTDADIAQAIWDSKPGGIATYGGEDATVEDSTGAEHTVYFSRPTELLMYLDATVVVDPDLYIGDDAATEYIVDWANGYYQLGVDVNRFRLIAAIMSIPGVVDLAGDPFFEAGDSSPDTSTDVAVAAREIAAWDTGRVIWSSTEM